MIARLRGRQRAVVTAIAVLLPLPVALALAGRPPLPRVRPASPDLLLRGGASTVLFSRDEPVPVRVALHESPDGRTVRVAPLAGPLAPDVLVYWSGSEDVVGPESVLLGSLDALHEPCFLPASKEVGALLLYSNAWQATVKRILLGDGDADEESTRSGGTGR